ncbi:MAG: helix-turn-helix transcriptional regulator [Bacteroidales bacterium]|nr:helix-turn-helix transcriptional regulator [Bacteroidales bacterium]
MKEKVTQISHSEMFEFFQENESIKDNFIASDNIKNILLSENILEDEVLNFPYLTNDLIIITCVEGYLKLSLDTKNLKLERSSVLVILPKQIFELTEISKDLKSIVYIMKARFWDNKNSFFKAIELQQHFFKESSIQLSDNMMTEAITIYKLIKQKLHEKGSFTGEIIQQYINILFYNVYAILQQQICKKPKIKPNTKEFIFKNFMKLVERHYKEQHSIKFYADRLHLTSKYLSSVVRSVSGRTAAHWICEYLLVEARALLKMGKMSIKQISNELNFYDQSHFGVFFKKHVGCSPREYQKS